MFLLILDIFLTPNTIDNLSAHSEKFFKITVRLIIINSRVETKLL